MKKRYILLIVVIVLMAAFIYISTFKIIDIKVSGCSKVDEQVIIDAIREQSFADNTIVLYFQNKDANSGDDPSYLRF